MENKKGKVVSIILILIALVIGIIGGVVGSFVYKPTCLNGLDDSNSIGNSKNNVNSSTKVTNLDIFDDVVQNNFGKIMKAAGFYGGTQAEYFKDKKITNKDIPSYLIFTTIDASGLMKDEMTESEFEELVKQYFGEDSNYKHEEVSAKMCASHYYDVNDKKYHAGKTGGCGGAAGPDRIFYMMSKAELDGDNLVIYFRVIFPGDYNDKNENGYIRYYSDAEHTKELTNLDRDMTLGSPFENTNNIKQGGKYKVIMKKYKDDIYTFLSSEPIQ